MAVKQAVEKVDVSNEWDICQQAISGKATLPASVDEHQKPAAEIIDKQQPRRIPLSRILVLFTVAASVFS